jgi:hypothetical protein
MNLSRYSSPDKLSVLSTKSLIPGTYVNFMFVKWESIKGMGPFDLFWEGILDFYENSLHF